MKVAIICLCLVAMAVADKRVLLGNFFNGGELKNLVNNVVTNFGTDATEAQCEQECTVLSTNDILDKGCDLACKGIQGLIQKFHLTK